MSIRLEYNGMPIHITVGGRIVRWINLYNVFKYIKNDRFIIDGYELSFYYGMVYLSERNSWLLQYLPKCGVRNKIVLDIGAGCGESAKFYIENGASKVICIECDDSAYSYLKLNSLKENRIIPIHKYFEPRDLYNYDYDLLKMDIEGYEAIALNDLIKLKKSIVIEGHGRYIIKTLMNNGFNVYNMVNENQAIMQRDFE